MQTTFSTESFRKVLGYIFNDPTWIGKTLVFLGVSFANALVPVLPMILTSGYIYEIMRRIIVDGEEPSLPEWADWGKLLSNGLRFFGVTLIYSLPAIIFGSIGLGSYLGMSFALPLVVEKSNTPEVFILILLGAMLFMFILMGLSTLFLLLESVFLPVVLGNTVAHDSFKAGFDLKELWRLFSTNLGGFITAMILAIGLYSLVMVIGYLFYFSVVLCCLMYVVMLVGSVYMALVVPVYWAQVYREAKERAEARP